MAKMKPGIELYAHLKLAGNAAALIHRQSFQMSEIKQWLCRVGYYAEGSA